MKPSFCHLFRHFSVTMEPHCALKVAKHLLKNKRYYHHNANDRFGLKHAPATKSNPKGKSTQRLKSRKKNQFGRLAMQYYPGRGYKAAVRAFREELRLTRGLTDALTATGYKDTQRLLSPRQIRIIEDYLGEP